MEANWRANFIKEGIAAVGAQLIIKKEREFILVWLLDTPPRSRVGAQCSQVELKL